MFVNLVHKIRDRGYSQEQRGGHTGRTDQPKMFQIEEDILEMAENYPTMGTRAAAVQVGVSHNKAWNTLRQEQHYPKHYQWVQALQPEDHPELRFATCI